MADDCAQPRDIERGILDLQGIKRPFHAVNPPGQCLFPLKELQPPADALLAILGADRKHVRVQVRLTFRHAGKRMRKPRQRHRKADQRPCLSLRIGPRHRRVEGGNHLSADFRGDDKSPARHNFFFSVTPNIGLQPNAGAKLIEALALADMDGCRLAGSWLGSVRAGLPGCGKLNKWTVEHTRSSGASLSIYTSPSASHVAFGASFRSLLRLLGLRPERFQLMRPVGL